MSTILPAGKHLGKLCNYGISKTKNDKPQAFLVFDVNGVEITWYGGLDPKPKDENSKAPLEYTVSTLLNCGLKTETIEVMAAGVDANAFDLGTEMELVVEDNHYDGKVSSRIKWVNIPGHVGGPPRATVEEVSTITNSGALKAELIRQKKIKAGAVNTPKSPL